MFNEIYLDLQCPHKYMYDLKPLLRANFVNIPNQSPAITVKNRACIYEGTVNQDKSH